MAGATAGQKKRWGWGLLVLLVGTVGLLSLGRLRSVREDGGAKGEGSGEGTPNAAGQEAALGAPPSAADPPGADAHERFKRLRADPEALARARKSADAKRERLRSSRQQAAARAAAEASRRDEHEAKFMPPLEGQGNQAGKPLGAYVHGIVKEQFFPMARDCYEELLGRSPRASGRVVMNVVVAGEPAVGGVVDAVELGSESTIQDEAFTTCVRESMYAVEFDAPPEGHEQIDFSSPIIFAPAGADAGR